MRGAWAAGPRLTKSIIVPVVLAQSSFPPKLWHYFGGSCVSSVTERVLCAIARRYSALELLGSYLSTSVWHQLPRGSVNLIRLVRKDKYRLLITPCTVTLHDPMILGPWSKVYTHKCEDMTQPFSNKFINRMHFCIRKSRSNEFV